MNACKPQTNKQTKIQPFVLIPSCNQVKKAKQKKQTKKQTKKITKTETETQRKKNKLKNKESKTETKNNPNYLTSLPRPCLPARPTHKQHTQATQQATRFGTSHFVLVLACCFSRAQKAPRGCQFKKKLTI